MYTSNCRFIKEVSLSQALQGKVFSTHKRCHLKEGEPYRILYVEKINVLYGLYFIHTLVTDSKGNSSHVEFEMSKELFEKYDLFDSHLLKVVSDGNISGHSVFEIVEEDIGENVLRDI